MAPAPAPAPFDVAGPLPVGTTLLEASAGTGKTWTVGALVTRYVAEGRARLEEMLVITFGRAASQELRERVRDQLVAAERALAASLDPAGPPPARSDALLDHLLGLTAAERAEGVRRLRDALADFDAATIATTHQFCQLVLRSLGVAGDTDTGAQLHESLDDLVVQVVDDLYLARWGASAEKPPFDRACAIEVARAAVGDPHADLAGTSDGAGAGDGAGDPGPDLADVHRARADLARDVRAELERRKRQLGILSYDDLLARLAAALEDPDAPARERMRARWRVVLVDEFQDTDPVQWQVLDRAFSGHATLVLIGDPKQSIYAFRGGDVVAYLQAAAGAETRTLDTNRRTDADLLQRLQVVLRGAALGDERIVVREVSAHHPGSRLSGAPHPAPFRLRRVSRDDVPLYKGVPKVADARAFIARDLAADLAGLLASGATWCDRPLRAADVAVIVAERKHGTLVQQALAERGVPAVLGGGGHVLTTPAADAWVALLDGLDQPHRSAVVRAAALTPFLGHTVAELVAGADTLTDEVADRLRGWALVLRARGVAGLFEVAQERGLTARVLGEVGGGRLLTDLRHLAHLLHDAALRDGLGLTGLRQWLRDERLVAERTERPRRLDSDAAAVQVLTVHGSKGLQFPVVYLPFVWHLWDRPVDVARFHRGTTRVLDVRGGGDGWPQARDAHLREEAGEELRDLYVALTRAQSQVVTWWAPTSNTPGGGLHRLLMGRRPGEAAVPDAVPVRDDAYAARVLDLLEELGGPTHERATPDDAVADLPDIAAGALAVRDLGRRVDTTWRRTSYSGLLRAAEEQAAGAGPTGAGASAALERGVSSEPEAIGLADEPEPTGEPAATAEAAPGAPARDDRALVSPMADLPAGATFGSLVHGVLEDADPDAPDLESELRARVVEQLRRWPVAATADDLAAALVPLHHTPLGRLAPGLTLAQVPLRDRLRELDFEFPLAGGDVRPGPAGPEDLGPRLRDLAPLLRRHLPADDALAAYAEELEAPALGDQPLRGYLSGSVDAVLRVSGPDGPRFVVVDYKTNRLGDGSRPLGPGDYDRAAMAGAMLHSHYPLQALLYSVVLHRYLRWRLSGYDPERHLGGVLYLFVRGMCGAETPVEDGHVAGVLDWEPPPALVVELSDLLAGLPRRAPGGPR